MQNYRQHDLLQKSTLPLALVEDLYNQTSWSTYRPHLYFGLKIKHPESPLFGIIWYQQPNGEFPQELSLRHWCDHGDNVKFSWLAHDGRSFGRELIEDNDLGMQRMPLKPMHWYSTWLCRTKRSDYIFVDGYSSLLGQFGMNLRLSGDFSSEAVSSIAYKIPPFLDMRHVNELLKASIGRKEGRLELVLVQNEGIPGSNDGEANFAAVQITFSKNITVELELLAEDDEKMNNFESNFIQKLEQFEQKFDEVFPVDYQNDSNLLRHLARVALSSLLGGIGVWHGDSLVKTDNSEQIRPYGPLSLISAVPSRPFFPRGFLWDEGFHNLVIRHFDPQLTLQIFASWLDSMNIDGWMPREMILGLEAQARVPSEFLVQSPFVANPPMFFFVLEKFLRDSPLFNRHSTRLSLLYPRIKQFYLWLRETQKGPKTELNPKVLPSGLDDFPRATHPSAEEYHLDLRCWMALSSKVLRQLAETFGDSVWVPTIEEDVRLYNDINALDKLHWSESAQQYADFGLHSDRVQLFQEVAEKRSKTSQTNSQRVSQERIFKRKTVGQPRLRLVDNVFGYVNLFPLLLRLLPPDNAKIGIILRSLNRTEHLWTPFGLRSLSTKSPYYLARNTEHDPPYWRGPIWININYLALDALRHYATSDGPFAKMSLELYHRLRDNVIHNIAEQYTRTGFLWENYNDRTGEGMGTRPFTGWTALVVNILAEKFD
uniref:Mannosyl-oligosaccharide glucosidase n=1 Tax=Globodera rostochiensis TaxID=31243 RepID=A0A914I6Y3_GLORO